jgi:hypothetical protein
VKPAGRRRFALAEGNDAEQGHRVLVVERLVELAGGFRRCPPGQITQLEWARARAQ